MNVPISRSKTLNPKPKHPYEALMKGVPGVVALYLLSTSDEEYIPYVDIYAPDLNRLNIQPQHLMGKPYDWHGISAKIREPRVEAINRMIENNHDAFSYTYQYPDRGTLWEFDCRLVKMPDDYLLIFVADTQPWQSDYWLPAECAKLSLHDDELNDDMLS